MIARPARTLPSIATVTLAALLAACSGGPLATHGVAPATAGPAAAATATATAAPTQVALFPVDLTDDEGGTATIPAEPEQIVTLTPAATEILFELGVGDRIVGKVEDFTPYPEAAASIPDVARFGSVDVETIVGLDTDLVIAGGDNFNPPEAIEQLRNLGIPVLVVFAPDVETALADFALIGQAVGRPDEAAVLAEDVGAAFDEVSAATAGSTPRRTYYELDASSGYFGPAPDYFGTGMIRIAGGDPLTSGTDGVYQLEAEQILDFDPEVILLGDAAYGVTPEQVAARPGWDVLTAVRNGDIRPIDDVIVTRPGPRLDDGIRTLALAIDPELDLP